MQVLFLHLWTICSLQLLLFSYLQYYQKLVCKHMFCTNFHYSLIPDTSNPEITQSKTQTPFANPIVSSSVAHASSFQEILIDAEAIQQHIYNYIGPYPYDPPESFQWFLMAGNWKKRTRCQFWQDIC